LPYEYTTPKGIEVLFHSFNTDHVPLPCHDVCIPRSADA
jgi:hypothetical protein